MATVGGDAAADGVEGPHQPHGVGIEVARCHAVAAGGIPRLLSCGIGKRREADRQEGDEGTCTGIDVHAFDLQTLL